MRYLLLALVPLVISAVDFPNPRAEIFQYLALSAEQRTAVDKNSADVAAFAGKSYYRIAILREEIDKEIVRDSPDPAEVGVRRVEIENTCRAILKEQGSLYERNLAVLTPAQKDKLKTLQAGMATVQTIVSAQSAGLMQTPPYVQVLPEVQLTVDLWYTAGTTAFPSIFVNGIAACGGKGGNVLVGVLTTPSRP
ncbi:MAG: hypothetical protein HY820_20535 [Acidobacteria bacterium]|nr:hypothetical protein [Acidobacteriota bacterium]